MDLNAARALPEAMIGSDEVACSCAVSAALALVRFEVAAAKLLFALERFFPADAAPTATPELLVVSELTVADNALAMLVARLLLPPVVLAEAFAWAFRRGVAVFLPSSAPGLAVAIMSLGAESANAALAPVASSEAIGTAFGSAPSPAGDSPPGARSLGDSVVASASSCVDAIEAAAAWSVADEPLTGI
jgi:hypothetical protein